MLLRRLRAEAEFRHGVFHRSLDVRSRCVPERILESLVVLDVSAARKDAHKPGIDESEQLCPDARRAHRENV